MTLRHRFLCSRLGMALQVLAGRPVCYRMDLILPFDACKNPNATVVDCTFHVDPLKEG